MTGYTVRVTRWAEGWELDIEGVGVTQSTSLSSSERMVRSYLAMDEKPDAATADVVFEYPAFADEIATTKYKIEIAVRAQADAAAASRELVHELASQGLKGAEIATVLEVSPQRVSQLMAPGKPRR